VPRGNSPTQCPWKARNHTRRQLFAFTVFPKKSASWSTSTSAHAHTSPCHHATHRHQVHDRARRRPTTHSPHDPCGSRPRTSNPPIRDPLSCTDHHPTCPWCGGKSLCHLPRQDVMNDGDGVGRLWEDCRSGGIGGGRVMDGGLPVNSAHQQPCRDARNASRAL
jgi:hypothetical protein